MWASTREHLTSGFANNKGADQPAHARWLIIAFVIHAVAEETGLGFDLSETPKTGFLASRPM